MPEQAKPKSKTSALGNLGQLIYNQYVKARGGLADYARSWGDEGDMDTIIRGPKESSATASDPHAYKFHAQTSKNLMGMMAPYVGDNTAIGAMRLLGVGNESLAGLLAGIKGQPVFDERGFDVGDLMANEQGIDAYLNRNKPKPRPFTNIPATMSSRD